MINIASYLEASVLSLESYLEAQFLDLSEIEAEWKSFLEVLDAQNPALNPIREIIIDLSDFSTVHRAQSNLNALKDRIEDLKRRNLRILVDIPRDEEARPMNLDEFS